MRLIFTLLSRMTNKLGTRDVGALLDDDQVALAVLVDRTLAIGIEARAKPDNLNQSVLGAGALKEDDWFDIFLAWAPTKHLALTLAWVDLGNCYATKGFYDEFGPTRIRDTPLSESAFVGAGIGGLGHLGLQYARIFGTRTVAVDVHDDKLQLAKVTGSVDAGGGQKQPIIGNRTIESTIENSECTRRCTKPGNVADISPRPRARGCRRRG